MLSVSVTHHFTYGTSYDVHMQYFAIKLGVKKIKNLLEFLKGGSFFSKPQCPKVSYLTIYRRVANYYMKYHPEMP